MNNSWNKFVASTARSSVENCCLATACGVAFILSFSGCRDRAPTTVDTQSCETPAIVAQVGSNVITVASFQKEILRREQTTGKRFNTMANLEAVLEEIIRFETLYAQAQTAGYERDPEMQERFRRLVVAKYQEDHLPGRENEPLPKEAEIETYYQQHIEEFRQPKQVRVAMNFQKLSAKATAEKQAEAVQRAQALREEALRGSDIAHATFGDLVRRHSEDPATRYQGGDCGWVSEGKSDYPWPRPVVEAMFALTKPGEVSPVVRAADGLYLIKLLEARDSTPLPLANVRDRIAWHLRTQAAATRQREFHQQQRAGLNITVNREELNRLEVQAASLAGEVAVPPPLPSP